VKLDPGAHVFYAFGFALKSGCDNEKTPTPEANEVVVFRDFFTFDSDSLAIPFFLQFRINIL
jgi:hypothetical protein